MIRQVIVVEGKSDIARVSRAVDADMIATGGFSISRNTLEKIESAYKKRGIIILTDPDGPGERIRQRLTKLFPKALHAFIPKSEAVCRDDVGVENASAESIQKALSKLRIQYAEDSQRFRMNDLFESGLTGREDSSRRRAGVGAILGIGYGNSKQFLKRLNHFDITREEWDTALQKYSEENP